MIINKYIDAAIRLLDPAHREIEPEAGDRGQSEMTVRAIDVQARTVEAVVSTDEVDRYEEIVEPKAYKKWLKQFMRNPVMLPAHQHASFGGGEPMQIGNWLDVRIEDKQVVGVAWFNEGEIGEQWWKLYSHPDPRKRAKGFSVGFLAHAWEMREFELVAGVKKRLRVFTEAELLEISAVPIPANRAALARAAQFSGELLTSEAEAIDYDKLAAAITPAIIEGINKVLIDPVGPVDALIREVVAACLAGGSHGHPCSHDDTPSGGSGGSGGGGKTS
ncbi:MAG: HK97 family phage prohead protease, partial [Phycisphaeraceae bacterium]|nr:HK97 family phage prohead protease [Phycisphaeraceae bacterium]